MENNYLNLRNNRPLDVIAMGRICIDFNPVDYHKPWKDCETFTKYVGGSPANTAIGLSRLGKKTGFIGCLSDDQLGDFCLDVFRREGIDTSSIVRAGRGEKLGIAFTEILSPEDSSLVMYRDNVADLQLKPDDVKEEYIAGAKILIVNGTALAASPSREAVLKALALADKNDTAVVFDVDYRAYTWKSREEIALYYSMAAGQADVIIGSREEYDLMDSLISPGLDDEQTARRWFSEKAKIVIIKHGAEGSTAYTADGKSYSIKPFPVERLKFTGGGDAYGSAFISGILDGWDIPRCLELGSASASMLVSSHSCSDDMPTLKVIQSFIKKEKELYGEMVAAVK